MQHIRVFRYSHPALDMPGLNCRFGDLAHDVLDARDRHRINAGERLVKQDDFWFRHEAAGNLETPPLAT